MAYQNVGTPRFYVNVLEWLNSVGSLPLPNIFRTLPVVVKSNFTDAIAGWDLTGNYPPAAAFGGGSFIAILGHNLASQEVTYGVNATIGQDNIINGHIAGETDIGETVMPDYDGWSLSRVNLATHSWHTDLVNFSVTDTAFAGSIILGTYYTMPHSPDLNLTMTREMDGVKRIRTKGGADLVNHRYYKPAMWVNDEGVGGAAWELYDGTPSNQKLSRSGRRTWSLSFNYLQGSDIFPMLSSLNHYGSTSPSGTPYSDTVPADDIWNHIQLNWEDIAQQWQNLDDDDPNYWWTDNTLLDSDNFYSQVVQKVQGSRLPFIFQPDSNNNNDFAICKFDKSFSFQQTAPNLYSVKMKIREVW